VTSLHYRSEPLKPSVMAESEIYDFIFMNSSNHLLSLHCFLGVQHFIIFCSDCVFTHTVLLPYIGFSFWFTFPYCFCSWFSVVD